MLFGINPRPGASGFWAHFAGRYKPAGSARASPLKGLTRHKKPGRTPCVERRAADAYNRLLAVGALPVSAAGRDRHRVPAGELSAAGSTGNR